MRNWFVSCTSILSLSLINPFWKLLISVRGYNVDSTTPSLISPFCIIVDGGSTGSRLHIYEFVFDSIQNETHCIRRGSTRVQIPLSKFKLDDLEQEGETTSFYDPSTIAQHMIPLFEYAAQQIPPIFHTWTLVKIQATAGMRLLSETQQRVLYDSLYQGLMEHSSFVFTSLKRSDIATLSGNLEGFYGVVAANYLQGNIDPFLNVKRVILDDNDTSSFSFSHGANMSTSSSLLQTSSSSSSTPLVGALDMGGSSTQIVYFSPGSSDTTSKDNRTCSSDNVSDILMENIINNNNNSCEDTKINPDDFVSISHLSFGVDQFRHRLYDSWIQDPNRFNTSHEENMILFNPCHFNGYTSTYKGYTMIGTGNASSCAMEINRLIPHHPHSDFNSYVQPFLDSPSLGFSTSHSSSLTTFRMVGGVQYPTLQGKFIAMSLFFFTLDCLRVLSTHEPLKDTWPSPTIHDLATALESLCSRQWYGDLEEIQHEAHVFTRAEVLPERCFESVYMVSLLRDGYGFHPNSQDITFTYLVGGSEVEWSLGMALSLFAQENHFLAVTELEDVVEHSDSLLSSWNRSVKTTKTNMTHEGGGTSKVLSQFLSDIIAHLPHWVSAMSYQEIATGRGHFLIL